MQPGLADRQAEPAHHKHEGFDRNEIVDELEVRRPRLEDVYLELTSD